MLSIILYGRNDTHGYNYHKRLALSLNCLAELLSNKQDEIIFIDFQSLDDFPTAPEAIEDTLTEKVKKHLKIYRIRPSLEVFKGHSILPAEPMSRNAAIRRTNPQNKWILSTNIDMLFILTQKHATLTDLVANLEDGFYQIPRFELPENLWERQLNRLSPKENIAFLKENALKWGLNTVVRRPGFLLYDNPGDFQLMTRDAIFKIGGFNENMAYGWHVDSNLSKRMSLYYKEGVKQLENEIWGYHCNHTRQMTSAHRQIASENCWHTFVNSVDTPYLPEQSGNWGLEGVALEEIDLGKRKLIQINNLNESQSTHIISKDTFNTLTYNSSSILVHLTDHFSCLPPKSCIAYFGHNSRLLELIHAYLKQNDLNIKILTIKDTSPIQELHKKTMLMIFDFGFDVDLVKNEIITPFHNSYNAYRQKLKEIMKQFLGVIRLEKKSPKDVKLIGVNALYTDYRGLFHYHLKLHKNTFVSGILYGYVKKKKIGKSIKLKINIKKRVKFYLLYILIRYFYNFTDRIRYLSYKISVLNKFAQHR